MRSGHARRLGQLLLGLGLVATGIVCGLQARLGVGPWDVLHGGVVRLTGVSFGRVSIGVGVVLVAACALLGVRPGLGTVLNVALIGLVEDAELGAGFLHDLADLPLAVRLLGTAAGIVAFGVGSALYIGAHYGAGPRDSLMVLLTTRTGWPIGVARGAVEVAVLVVGVGLGGPVGVGTLAFALGIGPSVQLSFRLLHQTPARRPVVTP